MPAKKRAKRPPLPGAPQHPDFSKINHDVQDTTGRVKDINVPTVRVEKTLSLFDRLAPDYKAFASADIKWLLRRFDGLRVVTNVADAPNGFDFFTWASEKEEVPAELNFDAYRRLTIEIFGPEKDVDEMYDFYHYQALVRDWRIRLGVQPTTPMRDWMLKRWVLEGPGKDITYPWGPSKKAVDAHGLLAAIQREAVVATEGEPTTTLREFNDMLNSEWGMSEDLAQAWKRYESGDLDGAGLAAAMFKSHFPSHSPIWFPATGDAVPNFVIVSDGSDEWFDHSKHVIFAGSAGFEDSKRFTYSPSPEGVLDLSARHLHEQWGWLASPWCFAGLDAVRGVRELRMNGHGEFFYTIGYAGTMPGPAGKAVSRPLRPLVPPGAPLRESLRVLDLSGNYFDSLGVFLEGLAGLEVLHLDDTNIAEPRGLAALMHCPNICTVTLRGTLLDEDLLARLGDDGQAWRNIIIQERDNDSSDGGYERECTFIREGCPMK